MSKTKEIIKKLTTLESKLDSVLEKLEKLERRVSTQSPVKTKNTKKKVPVNVVKVNKIKIAESSDSILITGDTYDIKNDFKVYRSKWVGEVKGWRLMLSNIPDYEQFKEELRNKCNKLVITEAEDTIETGATVNDVGDYLDNNCMIESSEDDD